MSFGDQLDFTTPRAGIKLSVSYKKWYNACGVEDGRGVVPDHVVEVGTALEKGSDAVLEAALGLIAAGRGVAPDRQVR